MTVRFFDWIWHINGSLALAPGQSGNEAFDRLDPLFQEPGTSYERSANALTFRKKDPAAQDKMSIFDSGILQVEKSEDGPVLRYRLASRALLFCFLAPLLFLAFAQLTVGAGWMEQSSAAEETKKPEKKDPVLTLHPLDQALGAPAPEKKKKDDEDKKPSPTSAYVFAGLFALLYVVGRVLESRLVKALFRRKLAAA